MLHTGDFRAESWWLESVKRNPFLQKYIAAHDEGGEEDPATRKIGDSLEAIYLDTACMLSAPVNMPGKVFFQSNYIALYMHLTISL